MSPHPGLEEGRERRKVNARLSPGSGRSGLRAGATYSRPCGLGRGPSGGQRPGVGYRASSDCGRRATPTATGDWAPVSGGVAISPGANGRRCVVPIHRDSRRKQERNMSRAPVAGGWPRRGPPHRGCSQWPQGLGYSRARLALTPTLSHPSTPLRAGPFDKLRAGGERGRTPSGTRRT